MLLMLRFMLPGLALVATSLSAQSDGVQHLRLSQTKVTQLLIHRVDAPMTRDTSSEETVPVFFQVTIGTHGEMLAAVPLRGQNVATIPPAQEVLKEWRWKPIQYQGKPAMIDTIVAVHFGSDSRMAKPDNGWFPQGLMEVGWDDAENLSEKHNPPTLPEGGTPGGKVHLHATLNEKGELTNVAVKDAPDAALGAAALKAVKTWRWQALHIDDKSIAIDTVIEVKFPKH